MSEIRPALSREEWEHCGVWRDGVNAWDFGDELTVGELSTRDKSGTPHRGFNLYDEDRHALAALALHGQPFGFTWEDVDALHFAGKMCKAWGYEQPDHAAAAQRRLNNLADRLAALLPPRETE